MSLFDLSNGVANVEVSTTGFGAFDGQEAALRAQGVRITPGKDASVDLVLRRSTAPAGPSLADASRRAVLTVSGRPTEPGARGFRQIAEEAARDPD